MRFILFVLAFALSILADKPQIHSVNLNVPIDARAVKIEVERLHGERWIDAAMRLVQNYKVGDDIFY